MKKMYVKILSAMTAVAIMGTTAFAGGTVVRAENAVSGTVVEPVEDPILEDYEIEFIKERQAEYDEREAKIGTTEKIVNEETGVEQIYTWEYVDKFICVMKPIDFYEDGGKKIEEYIKNVYEGFDIQFTFKRQDVPNDKMNLSYPAFDVVFKLSDSTKLLSRDEMNHLMEQLNEDSRVLWAGYEIKHVCIDDGYIMGIPDADESYPIEYSTPVPTQTNSIPTSPKTTDVTTAFPWLLSGSLSLLTLTTLNKRERKYKEADENET